LSIAVVEKRSPGFTVGQNLKKLGLKAQDTTQLFFDNVEVPVDNLLGEEGRAFEYLLHNLAQERLTIAVAAIASARSAVSLTVDQIILTHSAMSIGEMFDLEDLAADCAVTGHYDSMLVAAPLPIKRAINSPVNPIAIR
jgi:alkylation response protein AidB-like acyl-CoA dehydrogenase